MNEIPFDESTMTIILGLGDPEAPGMHGPMECKNDKKAIDLITQIRDMCDDYLMKCGKDESDGDSSVPRDPDIDSVSDSGEQE